MNRVTNHLIVISFDCLSALDLPLLKTLPHFSAFFEKGTVVPNVETIYPSVTYPCHATIVTGNYPNRHGVVNNTRLQPGNASPDWNWQRNCITGTTLYDQAKKAGLKTAALLWPVTAKAKIDYNMPEIFANRPWQNQVMVSLLNGSPLFQLDLNRRFGRIRNGLSQPELDDFVLESAVYTLNSKLPNLLLIHFTDLDTQRHLHGFSSSYAVAAIKRHDQRLGRLIQAIRDSGKEEDSTLVILGDHSAIDENKAILINVLFYQNQLISLNENGRLDDWKAYCQSCDGSAYVYLKDHDNPDVYERVKHLLYPLLEDQHAGIEAILTAGQAAEKGADSKCAFMLEAKRGYYFLEDIQGELIKTITEVDVMKDKKYTFAAHGYSPQKENYSTVLLAKGKGIKQKTVLPSIRLIDEGPTFARLLGLNLENTDGRIIEELLDL